MLSQEFFRNVKILVEEFFLNIRISMKKQQVSKYWVTP